MFKTLLSRRKALIGGATLPLAAGLVSTTPARANAPMQGASLGQFNRVKIGSFEVTTLLDGSRAVEDPQTIFGMNVTPEAFAEASEANFIPDNITQFYFTPTLVNTGNELVLFDTGLGAGGIVPAMAAAGYTPDQVDIVVITHMHGDHIGGLITDGNPTFPNARYVTGAVENNHWAAASNDNYEAKVRPLVDKTSFIDDGAAIAPGITSVATFGHSPGHMTYMIESDGKQLLLAADTANHYVWSLAYPDWEVRFDMDKGAAAASRRKTFGMLAADRIPFIGYHMPFPAIGFVEAKDDGFRFVPASYQLLL